MRSSRVLGVDLACRSWEDTGAALLEFAGQQWTACRTPAIPWPARSISAESMADAIDEFARAHHVAAVCLDGPQGWREPGVPRSARDGCGRWAEFQARTQGKTGEHGTTYPGNQRPWIEFCIEVFDRLLQRPGVALVNDPGTEPRVPNEEGYLLLEVFPTSIWRTSGLKPLPGKSKWHRAKKPRTFQSSLRDCYRMPELFIPANCGHDDLQAIVSALAGVALLGGPAHAVPRGKPAHGVSASAYAPAHRVEGIIWDARSAATDVSLPGE